VFQPGYDHGIAYYGVYVYMYVQKFRCMHVSVQRSSVAGKSATATITAKVRNQPDQAKCCAVFIGNEVAGKA
jgi:hypothetical protein